MTKHNYLNRPTSPLQPGTLLMRGLMLGLVAAGAAMWLRSLGTESEAGVTHAWRNTFTSVKDAVKKAAQKWRDANPSAKDAIFDLEDELQPGG